MDGTKRKRRRELLLFLSATTEYNHYERNLPGAAVEYNEYNKNGYMPTY